MVGLDLDSRIEHGATRDRLATTPDRQADAFARALADAKADQSNGATTEPHAGRQAAPHSTQVAQAVIPLPGVGPAPILPEYMPGTDANRTWTQNAINGLRGFGQWWVRHQIHLLRRFRGWINPAKPHAPDAPHDAADPNGPKARGQPGPTEGFVDPKGGPRWVPNPNAGKGGSDDCHSRTGCISLSAR
jgi:hypothetical protein